MTTPLGETTPVVILKTLVFDVWVRIQHENAWTSAGRATLKSGAKWNAECVWHRVLRAPTLPAIVHRVINLAS